MTNLRKTSVNIAVRTATQSGVVFVEGFMHEYKDELLPVMREAEKTENWTSIAEKVREILKRENGHD